MCRSTTEGGRRCPSCVGQARRSADRGRYARKVAATQGPASVATVGGADQVAVEPGPASWGDTQTLIAASVADINKLIAEANFVEAETRICEVGAAVNTEILARVGEPPDADTLEERLVLGAELESVGAELDQSRTNVNRLQRKHFADHPLVVAERESLDDLRGTLGDLQERMRELSKREETKDWLKRHGDTAAEVLAELRAMGSPETGLGEHPKSRKDHNKAVAAVTEAAKFYPTDWLEASRDGDPPLFIRVTSARAHYNPRESIRWDDPSSSKTLRRKQPAINMNVRRPPYIDSQDWETQWASDAMIGKKARVGETWKSKGRLRKVLGYTFDPETGDVDVTFDGGSKSVKVSTVDTRKLSGKEIMIDNLDFDDKVNQLRGMSGREQGVSSLEYSSANGILMVEYEDGRYETYATEAPFVNPHAGTGDTVATLTTDTTPRTTVHELAHRMEAVKPELGDIQQVFWSRRVTNNDSGSRFDAKAYHGSRSEKVYPDAGFVEDYSSKRYAGSGHYEILSTGMESVFCGSGGALEGAGIPRADKDHKAFVLGALAAL